MVTVAFGEAPRQLTRQPAKIGAGGAVVLPLALSPAMTLWSDWQHVGIGLDSYAGCAAVAVARHAYMPFSVNRSITRSSQSIRIYARWDWSETHEKTPTVATFTPASFIRRMSSRQIASSSEPKTGVHCSGL